MQNASTSSRSRVGAGPVLAVIGAALVIISKFLEFGKISGGGQSATVNGTGVILIAGVILAVVGVLMWLAKSSGADKALGILAIIAGAFGAIVSAALLTKDAIISSIANTAAQETLIKNAVDAGRLTVKIGLGPYLALAGSILVIVAGIANLVTSGKNKDMAREPMAAAPPPMPTPNP
ncbi:MAG: hypothetical protein ABR600_03300 [Actinomycetota bacterium]